MSDGTKKRFDGKKLITFGCRKMRRIRYTWPCLRRRSDEVDEATPEVSAPRHARIRAPAHTHTHRRALPHTHRQTKSLSTIGFRPLAITFNCNIRDLAIKNSCRMCGSEQAINFPLPAPPNSIAIRARCGAANEKNRMSTATAAAPRTKTATVTTDVNKEN